MTALFELDAVEDDWVPLPYVQFPGDLSKVTREEWRAFTRAHPDRCWSCGTTSNLNSGHFSSRPDPSAPVGWLCDACADVHNCRDMVCEPVRWQLPSIRPMSGEHGSVIASCECGWYRMDMVWDTDRRRPLTAAELDAEIREHAGAWHRSYRGRHRPDEHAGLVAARARRRTAYLRKVAA